MYNNLKTKQNEEVKSEGILIFKDTMEYLIDGILTAEQYAELTRMIYATRWGDGVNEKEIGDKLLLGIWKTLKHTIKKSARNARYRENNTSKKSALQDTVGAEFDITPIINNIPSNKEIKNKPILDTQITQNDNQYQPKVESGLNSLKMGNNEIIENDAYMEQNTEDNNKEKDIEYMGNLLVFDETIGQYKYPSNTKEKIKEKVIEKNLPTVQVAATTQVPGEPTIPSFQEFLKETAFTLNDIIKDFKAGGIRATVQAPDRLNGLLNTRLGRFYKDEIEEYINARINAPVEEPAAFVSDEDKYGSDVMDFIENNQEILEALKATVDYFKYNEEDKELAATNANKKINSMVAASGKNNSEFVARLEKFCMDYSVSYDESKMNRLNEINNAV